MGPDSVCKCLACRVKTLADDRSNNCCFGFVCFLFFLENRIYISSCLLRQLLELSDPFFQEKKIKQKIIRNHKNCLDSTEDYNCSIG